MTATFLLALAVAALPSARPLVRATETSTAPSIDGVLDELSWTTAPIASPFTQKFPLSGTAPYVITRLRVLHDRSALYFGIECEQLDTPVIARLSRRDRAVESDRLTIDIDTRGDGKSAFHFEVNAAGMLVDALRFDEQISDAGDLLLDWDENWDAKTTTSTRGWIAEVKIPFRVLRFDAEGKDWGLEVRRYVSARQEIDEWAYVPRDVAGEMLHYGRLELDGPVAPSGGVEVRPFVLGRAGDDGFSGSLGGDARWHASDDTTLDLTINPDFAQVEADQVLLNLGNFELFFPEKRPFFLEGTNVFNTPLALLYTRRIQEVEGAAKLIGRTGNGKSVGALAALTRPAELGPRALYSVLRIAADAGDHASVGGIATAVRRFPSVTLEGTTHNAYAGGLDARWRSPSGDYVASGQIAGVAFDGGPARALPDGTTIRGGDFDAGGTALFAKEGGNWLFELEYHGLGRRFDLNDAGYLERQNLQRFWFAGARRDTDLSGLFLENRTQIEIYHRRSFDELNLAEGYQLNNSGKFSNFMEYFVEVHYRAKHFDDRELGNGIALERAGLFGLELAGSTDPRSPHPQRRVHIVR